MGKEHAVGLRELRHKTSEVLRRVRAGESLDVTDRGTPVARLIPVSGPEAPSRLDRLIAGGVLSPPTHAGGGWPDPMPVEGPDSLAAAIEEGRTDRA